MNTTQKRMTMIFNEWARRYADNPKSFGTILDKHGRPVTDYGECCTTYFESIADEMDAKGLLPRPSNTKVQRRETAEEKT